MRTLILIALMAAVGVVLAAEENLVVNPSFEDIAPGGKRPIGWTQDRGNPVQVPDDGGHTGKRYVRMTDRTAKEGIPLWSKPVPARPGGQYRASAWVRTSDKGGPGVYINFFDDLGTRIHKVYKRAKGPTDGWVKVEVTAITPQDAADVSVCLYSYVSDVGTYDFDDVTLTVQGGAEPGVGKVPRAKPKEKTMVDIGSRLELFVDSFMVDSMTGDAKRLLHHPERR
ncbi:MAG: hypothetical protein GXP25_02575, partial [Planctomycetes bacterium]|nr:hypothetical protein [Planctomycetota bacterium]